MNLQPSEKAQQYLGKLSRFMDEHIYPNEEEMRRQHEALPDRWQVPPLLDELKKKARAAGLWNLFLPESKHGAGLANLEYAFLCEEMGKVFFASEVFNCSAPDTGNMEVIERYGNAEQQKEWLEPPLAREIRSAVAMTQPALASSGATNTPTQIRREGEQYGIHGREWVTPRLHHPRCKILIRMG